jgi:hypothetical protein
MRDFLKSLGMDAHVVLGNHDYLVGNERAPWDALYPNSINYAFEHRGWQFIGLDSTEGTKWEKTRIQPATFEWLERNLKRLNRAAPTVVFTHFPLGLEVPMRPLNADDLLLRFLQFNLVAVFNGHYHGFTERVSGRTTITTNRCCAISRSNQDGTPEKGYFLCAAREGRVEREFVPVQAG